jgi:hypothetical protein
MISWTMILRANYILYGTLLDNIPTEDTLPQICGIAPDNGVIIHHFCQITTPIGIVIWQKYAMNSIGLAIVFNSISVSILRRSPTLFAAIFIGSKINLYIGTHN